MAYCKQCGNEIESNVSFCPSCGADQRPAEPEKKVTGGIRGKSIAAVALGGESLGLSGFTLFYLLIQGIFSLAFLKNDFPVGVFFYVYVIIFGLISLGSSIAGKILAGKALEELEGYRLAKIGKTLNQVAIILNIAALALGLLISVASIAGMY